MHFYDQWAQQILTGNPAGYHAFYGLPLYPYWLALLFKIFGHNPFVPAIIQAAFDAGTGVLLLKISSRVFVGAAPDTYSIHPQAIGLTAGLAWTFFLPAEAYSIILMPTVFFVFTFWFLVWQIVKRAGPPTALACFACGLLLGVIAMGVATILFATPLLLLAIFRPSANQIAGWRLLCLRIVLLIIGVGLGTAPCWIHNCFIAHDPVFLSAHGGVNYWLGNNPDATGYPRFPGLHAGQAALLEDATNVAETAAGKPLTRAEVSSYWSAKAGAYITGNFSSWLRLLGHKIGNFANAFEYDDLNIIRRLRDEGVVFPGLSFGLVAALAIPGMFLALTAFPVSRWVIAAILLQLISILPIFVTERYRLAAVPGLLLLATFGLFQFWEALVKKKSRELSVYAASLTLATVIVSIPRSDPSLWALKAYNAGREALEANDLRSAEKELLLAAAYVPMNPETNFALGNVKLAQGRADDARNYYGLTLRCDAGHKGALNNLGVLALKAGDWQEAAGYFRLESHVIPNDSKSHFFLARAELGLGHPRIARDEIDAALRLSPDQPEYSRLREIISREL